MKIKDELFDHDLWVFDTYGGIEGYRCENIGGHRLFLSKYAKETSVKHKYCTSYILEDKTQEIEIRDIELIRSLYIFLEAGRDKKKEKMGKSLINFLEREL